MYMHLNPSLKPTISDHPRALHPKPSMAHIHVSIINPLPKKKIPPSPLNSGDMFNSLILIRERKKAHFMGIIANAPFHNNNSLDPGSRV
jgi:hypothetical protein